MNKQSEFIGELAEIPKLEIKGTIINETKHTLTIKTDKGNKTIIKNPHTIIINGEKINGKDINKRPEDRLKP